MMLHKCAIEEANIPLVQRALDVISLTDADPRARRAAALKLGNLRDRGVGLLEKALAHEADPDVRPVLVEALISCGSSTPIPGAPPDRGAFRASRAESALCL